MLSPLYGACDGRKFQKYDANSLVYQANSSRIEWAYEQLCARAAETGERMQARLREIAAKHKTVSDVRGLGAMVAIEFCHDGDPHRTNAELTKAVIAEALSRGLLLLSCGSYANVLRLMVPLTIEHAVLDEGLDILAASIDAVVARG